MQRFSNYRIALMLETILLNQETIMSGLDDITKAVAAQTSVEAGAVTLIQRLAEEVRNVPPNDDAALKALADQLTQATQPLANAIAANTSSAGSGAGAAGSGATGGSSGADAGEPAPAAAADAGAEAPVAGAASPGSAG